MDALVGLIVVIEFKWGVPKIRGTILGVPIVGNIVFWGLYWGPLVLGNYQLVQKSSFPFPARHWGRPSAEVLAPPTPRPNPSFFGLRVYDLGYPQSLHPNLWRISESPKTQNR